MAEATPRTSPRKFAVPLVIVAAFATGAALTWAVTRPPTPAAPADIPVVDAPPLPPAPVLAAPPLGRADLLAAARAATNAYAAGAAAPEDQASLVGRRFEVRIPFGCAGPQAEAAGAQAWWTYNPARGTVTITARPVVWTDAPLLRGALEGRDVEEVEGFWIPRPWIDAEVCPPLPAAALLQPATAEAAPAKAANPNTPAPKAAPAPAPTPRPAPAPQTLGLAGFHVAEGSRVARRGDRPYEVVRKVTPEEVAALRGFRLVLSGRVAAVSGAQPAICRAETPDQRPVCLIAVEFERVAFEDAAGETLAEWRS